MFHNLLLFVASLHFRYRHANQTCKSILNHFIYIPKKDQILKHLQNRYMYIFRKEIFYNNQIIKQVLVSDINIS